MEQFHARDKKFSCLLLKVIPRMGGTGPCIQSDSDPLCNLSLALISSVSQRLILRKRHKLNKRQKDTQKKTKTKDKMPKVQISPENKIYDGDGYLLRVACVCVRDNSENEVCNLCSLHNLQHITVKDTPQHSG